MKVILFGASGMVGQGVLRECLLHPEVDEILCIGRHALLQEHPKIKELHLQNLCDYSAVRSQLVGYDACFFCLGATAAGKSEYEYAQINYDIPVSIARELSVLNTGMCFTYVSGAGCDGSEQGKIMWARVKGRTENAILKLPLNAYMFRPGAIQPMNGEKSKTWGYQFFISLLKPLFPVLRTLFPTAVTTTERIGRLMIALAQKGSHQRILESRDINQLAKVLTEPTNS
jgi:uncharacterized protein YbjT (DUF2867 family)